jgi:hypothetical protein
MTHDKQWFIDRIGKRVYRDKNPCDCEICMNVFEKGVIIENEMHATYLYDAQHELQYIYSDKKLDTDKHEQRQ